MKDQIKRLEAIFNQVIKYYPLQDKEVLKEHFQLEIDDCKKYIGESVKEDWVSEKPKQLCDGEINLSNGRCLKCGGITETTSARCSRYIYLLLSFKRG